MNAAIRKFVPSDHEKLLRMYAQFQPKEVYRRLPPASSRETGEWLKELEAHHDQFIAEVGDRAVGHSILQILPNGKEAELLFFIHQNFRGLGLGRALLLGTLNHGCKIRKLDRVFVHVETSNPIAQETLEKLGFRIRDLNRAFEMEIDMERPSNCAKCRGERCAVFNTTVPRMQPLPQSVQPIAPQWSHRLAKRMAFRKGG